MVEPVESVPQPEQEIPAVDTITPDTEAVKPDSVAVAERGEARVYKTAEMTIEADVMNGLWNVATRVADTEFVPASFKGKPDKIFAAILQGRALGVDAMTSLREIAIIDGRPYMSAELKMGLARKAGHEITGEAYPDKAVLHGKRGDTGEEMDFTYTLEDAVSEGLVKLDADGNPRARSQNDKPLPWERFTSSMLWARAVSRLVDRLFPDVMIGDAL